VSELKGTQDPTWSFAHCHVHTEFSILDGASRIDDLVEVAALDGQPALGITDHGNMYGILPFYAACTKAGITPLLGTEAYMAYERRDERINVRGTTVDDTGGDVEGGRKAWYHLTLLAESNRGYANLIKLSSRAFLEGYYRKPKVDWELLADHADGLIATTGCLGGHVCQSLLAGRFDDALTKAGRLQDIFGKDNLFVELQDHGIEEQHRVTPQLIDIARRLGAPLLATNDSHYTRPEDAQAHDALLCVQTKATIDQPGRFQFKGSGHYLKSAAEMRRLFAELPEACDNTLLVARRADVRLELGTPKLPDFPVPPTFSSPGKYLEHLAFEGAKQRWGDPLPDPAVERLGYELKVIEDMGFSSYFLIVWDLIRHAKEHGIRVGPGRGSAAGCAVAYCLRITELDPIRYDLLFERFLNPSRLSMPDIDMDFDSRFRDEMIRYAAERYGRDHVAQIVTFGTIKARASVRDAARVLGYPYSLGDRVAKAMPPIVMGRDTPLWACLADQPPAGYEDGWKIAAELRAMVAEDPDVARVAAVAKGLEGLRRQDGIHAAAVVITKDPLTEYLPVQRKPEPGGDPESAPVVTQYEMHGVEDLGLLKMDFLGLRNLDVITDTVELIERTRGIRLDIDHVPLDDEPTYELLRRGDSVGVFQLEGGPMRTLMRSLAPTCFEDVAALIALYRPGPMAANMHFEYADRKNGRKKVEYLHPDAEPILADTFGLMIYQEKLMRVAQQFAGYSLAEADNLRKACLPRGTLLLTESRGYVPIEQVMTGSDRRVQTIDTTSASSRFAEVSDVWSVGVKPVFRLTTSTGYSLEATADHRFMVEDRWTRLEDVVPGDLVAVASRTVTEGTGGLTDAEIVLAALLVCGGCEHAAASATAGAAHFCSTDAELVRQFLAAFERHFGYASAAISQHHGATVVDLTSDELCSLRPLIGAAGAPEGPTITQRLVNAPKPDVERFLALCFCAGGWADPDGAHVGTKSLQACHSLKRMLLRCGIVASVRSDEVPGRGTSYVLSVVDEGRAKTFARLVGPHLTTRKAAAVERWLVDRDPDAIAASVGIPASFLGAQLRRKLDGADTPTGQLDGASHGDARARALRRQSLAGLLSSERLEALRTGDLVWDTVVAVEPVGDKECFDFQMADPDRPYALAEDVLVHNCGKKIRDVMRTEREKFVASVERNGYGRALGEKWFDIIEPFADYAFAKSHAFGYGLIAYQTAYLKANYPTEYLAALLTSVRENLDRAGVYLAECRALGIDVSVPDVNRSAADFTPVAGEGPRKGTILFGLAAVRNVGTSVAEAIVAEREARGPFADFVDFCERVPIACLNKQPMDALIRAGAFDSLGHTRKGLLHVHELIVGQIVARRREREQGVLSLFGDAAGRATSFDRPVAIPDVEFDKRERLAHEKEMLGLYVSDHPLLGLEAALRRRADGALSEVTELADGTVRTFAGVITGLQVKWTKRGEQMAVFILEDLESSIEVTVFPRTMVQYAGVIADDAVVTVRARVDKRDEQPKLIASEIAAFAGGPVSSSEPLRVRLPTSSLSMPVLDSLKEVLTAHRGDVPVHLYIGGPGAKGFRLPPEYCVDTSNGVVAALRVSVPGIEILPEPPAAGPADPSSAAPSPRAGSH
jgi:DNA polymerase-3 subunit alpha